jgi:uncharacterized protein YbcV (DUF1398 family)
MRHPRAVDATSRCDPISVHLRLTIAAAAPLPLRMQPPLIPHLWSIYTAAWTTRLLALARGGQIMNDNQTNVAHECAKLSAAGKIHFGEVVLRLTQAGIERYHADFTRMENTYYTPEGGSCVVPMEHQPAPIAAEFSPAQIEAAVGQAQRGEIMYPQFARQACAAGCVGYFVQLAGKCVQYFGRSGEIHTEWFPGAKKN